MSRQRTTDVTCKSIEKDVALQSPDYLQPRLTASCLPIIQHRSFNRFQAGFELKKPLVAKIAELLQNSLPRSC
jgi:hypothetical protein